MYIRELEIHNYRNFKDFNVEFKPITLIIGENNMGKTNLLDAIGLIFCQDVSFFKRIVLEVADFHQEIGDQVIILEENMYLDSRIL